MYNLGMLLVYETKKLTKNKLNGDLLSDIIKSFEAGRPGLVPVLLLLSWTSVLLSLKNTCSGSRP